MIKEQLLHYIWQFKKFDLFNLYTLCEKKIDIIHSGKYNTDAGPDFSLAKIMIDGIEWNGNIEIHVKSSDWIKHKHDLNTSYKNVILHVVYEADEKTRPFHNATIPVLELKPYISEKFLESYRLLKNKAFSFIPCENLLN
jgi:hypothetical protein